MAGVARLELVTSAVTGQRSNQLSYTPARNHKIYPIGRPASMANVNFFPLGCETEFSGLDLTTALSSRRGSIIHRPTAKARGWICRTLIRKTRDVRHLFLLPGGEEVWMRGSHLQKQSCGSPLFCACAPGGRRHINPRFIVKNHVTQL